MLCLFSLIMFVGISNVTFAQKPQKKKKGLFQRGKSLFRKGRNLIKRGQEKIDITAASVLGKKIDANADIRAEYSGGLSGGNFKIKLGGKKGKITLHYCTYEAEDRIYVAYDGKKIMDTGCLGTGGQEGSGVWKSISYNIDGKDDKVLVIVKGNCFGKEKGRQTKWLFKVSVEMEECMTVHCKICQEEGTYTVFGKHGNNPERIFFCKNRKIIDERGYGASSKTTSNFVLTDATKYDSEKIKKCLEVAMKSPVYKKKYNSYSVSPSAAYIQQTKYEFLVRQTKYIYNNFEKLHTKANGKSIKNRDDYWMCREGLEAHEDYQGWTCRCEPLDCKICQEKGTYAVFVKKPLENFPVSVGKQDGYPSDWANLQVSHEHLFYCKNGKITGNVGYDPKGQRVFKNIEIKNKVGQLSKTTLTNSKIYTDVNKMRKAVEIVLNMPRFKTFVTAKKDAISRYNLVLNNCQHFAERVRYVYNNYEKEGKKLVSGTRINENDYWKCKSQDMEYVYEEIHNEAGGKEKVKICKCK